LILFPQGSGLRQSILKRLVYIHSFFNTWAKNIFTRIS
jgi:hypothetical protein